MSKTKMVIYSSLLLVPSFLLAIHAMIGTTFFSSESFVMYLATLLPTLFFFIFAVSIESSLSVEACVLVLLLKISNISVPLLFYTSNQDWEIVFKTLVHNEMFSAAFFISTWGILYLIYKNRFQLKTKLILFWVITAGMAAVTVMILLAKSEMGSSFISVAGHSIQIAIPSIALSLSACVMIMEPIKPLPRVIMTVLLLAMNGVMIFKGETGVPLMVFIFCIFYFLLGKKKNKIVIGSLAGGTVLGITIVLTLHYLKDSLPDVGFLHEMSEKIETRIFSDNIYQLNQGKSSLIGSGLFGQNNYVYVPEGSSDFSLVTVTHFCGLSMIFLIFIALIWSFYETLKNTKKTDRIGDLKNLCAIFIIACFIINFLMICGVIPIVGVQIPFLGTSKTYACLSGFLLGVLTFDFQTLNDTVNQIKKIENSEE